MSPFKLSGTTVVSFSGGRTSAYMLRQVLDNNDDLSDLVVTFANTGKEHPATLEFVREAEWWARMESSVVYGGKFTGDGDSFRSDRPSYQHMLDYSDTQLDMFANHDDAIDCFCGD